MSTDIDTVPPAKAPSVVSDMEKRALHESTSRTDETGAEFDSELMDDHDVSVFPESYAGA